MTLEVTPSELQIGDKITAITLGDKRIELEHTIIEIRLPNVFDWPLVKLQCPEGKNILHDFQASPENLKLIIERSEA